MPVRASMAALIARVRLLINDPSGSSEQFADQDIQDVLDESRLDIKNEAMIPKPTFSGSTIQYLDYYTPVGGWEDDYVIKQFLVNVVTPATAEPIPAHFTFATTTLPPLFISGKQHDIYRASADLLERLSARWMLRYAMSVNGQSLQRNQAMTMILDLVKTYRLQQRAKTIYLTRSDIRSRSRMATGLEAIEIDYMSSGNGR